MNIEEVREYALSLRGAKESLFAEDWVQYRVVEPAYHMNKRLWNDLYLERDLDAATIQHCIKHSYDEVVKKLPKNRRCGSQNN